MDELDPEPGRPAASAAVCRSSSAARRSADAAVSTADQTVVTYEPGRIPGTLTQQVIKKYDKDGDFELTREEMRLRRRDLHFASTRDGNGKLDGEELDVWRTGPPDLEVSLSLAPKAADCVAKLETDAKTCAARGFTVKQVETGRLIVRTGRQPIEFWAFAPVTPAISTAAAEAAVPVPVPAGRRAERTTSRRRTSPARTRCSSSSSA